MKYDITVKIRVMGQSQADALGRVEAGIANVQRRGNLDLVDLQETIAIKEVK